MSADGCCPDHSHGYLMPDCKTKGVVVELNESNHFYGTGSTDVNISKGVVIIIPDIFGWNAGLVRKIADKISEEGYYAIVPKILQPCLEGGCDGDGM